MKRSSFFFASFIFLISCGLIEDIGLGNNSNLDITNNKPLKTEYSVGDTIIFDFDFEVHIEACDYVSLELGLTDPDGNNLYDEYPIKKIGHIYYDPPVTKWNYYNEYIVDTVPSGYSIYYVITPWRIQDHGGSGFGDYVSGEFKVK